MKTALAILAAAVLSGCVVRDNSRYNAAGQLWSRDRVTFFLVRGEASKIREQVREKAGGDYERETTIGQVKGETETDKLKDIIGEAVERAVKGAVGGTKP